jgi:PAS domain-containing protein
MQPADVLDLVPKPVALVSDTLDVEHANAAFRRLTHQPGEPPVDPAVFIGRTPGLALVLLGALARLRTPGRTMTAPWISGSGDDAVSWTLHVTRADPQHAVVVFDRVPGQVAALSLQQHARHFLEGLLNRLHVGVVGLDSTFRITFFNRFQASLFADAGGSQWSYDAIGVPIQQRYRVLDGRQWDDLLGSLGPRQGATGSVRTIHRGTGGVRHLLIEVVPVEDAAGALQGAICVTEDVTRLAELEEQVLRRERIAAVADIALALQDQVSGPLATLLEETRALCEDASVATRDESATQAHRDAIEDAVGRIVRAAGTLAALSRSTRNADPDGSEPGTHES